MNMSSEIKIYKVKDFIRLNEAGKIDFDRSMRIVRDLATAASFHTDCNILVDLRETEVVGEGNMGMVMQVALEMVRYGYAFKGKIANVVPDEEKRLLIAKQFEASLNIQGFDYKVFTSFEDAINWLSEVKDVSE